jgi:hypothetical protein
MTFSLSSISHILPHALPRYNLYFLTIPKKGAKWIAMSKMLGEAHVIKLGGSLIVPNGGIDVEYVKKFNGYQGPVLPLIQSPQSVLRKLTSGCSISMAIIWKTLRKRSTANNLLALRLLEIF